MEMLAAIMFVLALVMLHYSLGKGINKEINCTFPELKYSIINKTSGSDEVIACSKCRKCGLGKELKVPCGTTLGINEGHGDCNDCGEGMYSDTDDASPCKMCGYRLCSEHQLYEGNCTKGKDESHCLPACKAGYIWNKEYSKCEVDLPELKTTMPSSTLPPTTKPADLNDSKVKTNEHPFTVIVGAVIGGIAVVVAILIFIIVVCYRCKILEPNPEVVTEVSDPDSHTNDEPEHLKLAKQEVFSEVNESSKAVFPTKESFHEFERPLNESDSASNSSVEPTTPLVQPNKPNTANHGTNNRCFSNTPLTNSPVGVDQHGTVGMSWRDLAGWLGYKRADVSLIELKENKTDHVIRRWEKEAENTVIRFVEILEEKKMTCLAEEIRTELGLY